MNEPLDQLHEDQMVALAYIRQQYRGLRNLIQQWEPRPLPPTHMTTTDLAAPAATNEQESPDA
jgi:hypothetical protein